MASATKTSPLESTATPVGWPIEWAPAHEPPARTATWPARTVSPSIVAAAGGQDQDPAMTRVGDEEVAGRIEGEAARRVEGLRAEQRPHAGRRRRTCRARRRRLPRDDRHQQRRPAQHQDEEAPHPFIMPVAHGVRPESRAIVGGAAQQNRRRTNERKGDQPWQHPKKPSRPRT